jgi:DNA repair exonuclease SbcCD nuclease subunit
MTTFIHTSDWHIGSCPGNFDPGMRRKLTRARLRAVEAIFMYAQRMDINLVLCAGDIMDEGQMIHEKHLLELFPLFRRYPGINVVMVTGGSDPLAANTVYRRVLPTDYPANVHLVKGNEIIPIPSINLKIFASSRMNKEGVDRPFAWANSGDIDKDMVNIGLAHFDTHEEFDFEENGMLDYLALGGRHSSYKPGLRSYYCGTPEPLDFDDDGYALKVAIEKHGAPAEVRKIRSVRQFQWQSLDIELSDPLFNRFKETFEAVGDNEIRRAGLTGALSVKNYTHYKEILRLNRNRYMEIKDQVSLVPDEDDLAGINDGYAGDLVRRLMDMKQAGEPLPAGILDGVIPAAHLPIEQSMNITHNEIIDRALLKLFSHFQSEEGE